MKKIVINIGVVAVFGLLLAACTTNPDSPGIEYMPDMYRSPSVGGYVDNGEIRNKEHLELKTKLSAKVPPKYTIPFNSNKDEAGYNMPLPFLAPYGSDISHNLFGWDMYGSTKETDKALIEVVDKSKNPIPYSEDVAKEGKELYSRLCSVCHGDKGNGKGILVQNGKINGVADFTGDAKETSEGRLFYYISYGKGVMGAHAMLTSRTERWKIVHHLRKFQDSKYPNVEKVMTEAVVKDSIPNNALEDTSQIVAH